MTSLALLYALAVPLLIGVPILVLLGMRWREDRLGFPAWAWLVGCLGLGAVLQAGLEIGLSHRLLCVFPLLLAVLLALLARRRASAPGGGPAGEAGYGYALFVACGALFCLWFALAGMDRPCIEGDEGNIWSLKAKSLLVDFPDMFAATQIYNLHPDYPQLNPLLQVWVYVLTGVPDFVQFENRWPIQICDIALFVATAAALRHRLPPLLAGTLAALVLLEPEFQSLCRTAYADGMVALGLVVGLDAFLRWRDGGSRGYAWLSGLGLAFALWSKNETMLYLASAGIAALLVRLWCAPLRGGWAGRNLVLLVPSAAIIVNTALWNRRFGMKSDLFGANPTGKSMFELMAEQWPDRVPALLSEALQATVTLQHVHVVFALVVLGAVLAPRSTLGGRLGLPTLALVGSFVGLHVVYVGSFLPLRMHLDTSYLRVLFQILPPAIVLLGAIVADVRTRQTSQSA